MNLSEINKRIIDRSDVFYWQAERKISDEEAGKIFKDRHEKIKNNELLKRVNECLIDDKLAFIEDFKSENANFGNVNSCRFGRLESGKEVVIRCHPQGIANGYFFVESLAAANCINHGLPAYNTYAIHECVDENDCAFQVIDKLQGQPINAYLLNHPEKEEQLVFEIGKTMAKMHSITNVDGFGSFNNDLAKQGVLCGLYDNFYDSYIAGLDYDLKILQKFNIITKEKADAFKKLFSKDNPLIKCDKRVFVHNDFADWNLMTDGETVSGIMDFDECVAGDPIRDMACWSTFFNIKRVDKFLEGYFSISPKPDNFEPRFQLWRLRYNISKMCLRTRRYTYNPREEFRLKIERGKNDLKVDAEYFGIRDSQNSVNAKQKI